LKKTSTVTSEAVDSETGEITRKDPAEGTTVNKFGGAKIRDLLANLNSEKD
jgi:hypothetical protein